MSTTVTMRPRRLSTPAISPGDSGTRVSRSGMNTSWTREIGSSNNSPPIIVVAYSPTAASLDSLLRVMPVSLPVSLPWPCRPPERVSCRRPMLFGGLFLQRRDQPGTVELGDVIVEAGLPAALDRRRRHHRGQCDDRHRAQVCIRPDRLGELEPVHVRHF